jgi:hypothetical protein
MQDIVPFPGVSWHVPALSDERITALAQDISYSGYAVLPGFVSEDVLPHLRAMVRKLTEASGGEYVLLNDQAEIRDTLLGEIGRNPNFLCLLRQLYNRITGTAAPKQSVYQTLRCIAGKTGRRHAYYFHYDSYVITALLPIFIPAQGKVGDLVMKPHHRQLRMRYASSFLDKLLLENWVSQHWLRRKLRRSEGGFLRLRPSPGSLYLFCGYGTLHGNEECDIDQIRATALFHFGDPHLESPLRKVLGRAGTRAHPEC